MHQLRRLHENIDNLSNILGVSQEKADKLDPACTLVETVNAATELLECACQRLEEMEKAVKKTVLCIGN